MSMGEASRVLVGKKGYGGLHKWNFLKRVVLEPGTRVPVSYQAIFDDPWIRKIDPVPPSHLPKKYSPITRILVNLHRKYPLLGEPYVNIDDPSIPPSLLEIYAWKVYKLLGLGYSKHKAYRTIERSIAHEQMVRRMEFQALQEKLASSTMVYPKLPSIFQPRDELGETGPLGQIPNSYFYDKLKSVEDQGVLTQDKERNFQYDTQISQELTFLGLARYWSALKRNIHLVDITLQELELIQMFLPKYPEFSWLFPFLQNMPSLGEATAIASIIPILEKNGYSFDRRTGKIYEDHAGAKIPPSHGENKWASWMRNVEYLDPRELRKIREITEKNPDVETIVRSQLAQRVRQRRELIASEELEFEKISNLEDGLLTYEDVNRILHPGTEREILFGHSFDNALKILEENVGSRTTISPSLDSENSENFDQLLKKIPKDKPQSSKTKTPEEETRSLLFEYYHRTLFEKDYEERLAEWAPEKGLELVDHNQRSDPVDWTQTGSLPFSKQVEVIDRSLDTQFKEFPRVLQEYKNAHQPIGAFSEQEDDEDSGELPTEEIPPLFWEESRANFLNRLQEPPVEDLAEELIRVPVSNGIDSPMLKNYDIEADAAKISGSFSLLDTDDGFGTRPQHLGSVSSWAERLDKQRHIFYKYKDDTWDPNEKLVIEHTTIGQEDPDDPYQNPELRDHTELTDHVREQSHEDALQRFGQAEIEGFEEEKKNYQEALEIRKIKDARTQQWMETETIMQKNIDKQTDRRMLRDPLVAAKAQMLSDDKLALQQLIKRNEQIETDVSWDPASLEDYMKEYGYKMNPQQGEWTAADELPEHESQEFQDLARNIPRAEEMFADFYKEMTLDNFVNKKFEQSDINPNVKDLRKVVDVKVSANKFSDIFTSNPNYKKLVEDLDIDFTHYKVGSDKKE